MPKTLYKEWLILLNDPIERVTRDPIRKLGWEDRLIGGMRLAIEAGLEPVLLAEGTKLALQRAAKETSIDAQDLLIKIWSDEADKEEVESVLAFLIS